MTGVQVWLLVGVPALVLGLLLLLASRVVATLLAYVVLAAGFAVVTRVDRASGTVFAILLALLYATGRGSRPEPGHPDGHVPEVTREQGRGHAGA